MRQPRPRPSCSSSARTRYFPRQVILPADLTQDQIHSLDQLRRHNRLFHGWGVLCGFEIKLVQEQEEKELRKMFGTDPSGIEPKKQQWIAVLPGVALTPLGDEIVISSTVFVNVARERPDRSLVTASCGCHSTFGDHEPKRIDGNWALVVEAWEEQTGAVRAAGARCGDNPAHLEFARIEDTVVFKLILIPPTGTLPDPYTDEPGPTDPLTLVARIIRGDAKRCFVQIGTIHIEGEKITKSNDDKPEGLKELISAQQ